MACRNTDAIRIHVEIHFCLSRYASNPFRHIPADEHNTQKNNQNILSKMKEENDFPFFSSPSYSGELVNVCTALISNHSQSRSPATHPNAFTVRFIVCQMLWPLLVIALFYYVMIMV